MGGLNTRQLFHLVCGLVYVGLCISDAYISDKKFLPIPGQFFSKFVWLTLIDLYLQTIYHVLGVFVNSSRTTPQIYDLIGHCLVGPVGATVVILFWILYLFDPDTLLADDNAKAIIAISWFNHGIHTLPLVTSIAEIVLWRREEPSRRKALQVIGIFAILYVADIHYVHYISGFWAYPILGFLALPFRILFIVVCLGVIFLNYSILSFIHNSVHGQRQKRRVQ